MSAASASSQRPAAAQGSVLPGGSPAQGVATASRDAVSSTNWKPWGQVVGSTAQDLFIQARIRGLVVPAKLKELLSTRRKSIRPSRSRSV